MSHKIRNYWRDKGYLINIWIEEFIEVYRNKNRRTLYAVRSDLINGLPGESS